MLVFFLNAIPKTVACKMSAKQCKKYIKIYFLIHDWMFYKQQVFGSNSDLWVEN